MESKEYTKHSERWTEQNHSYRFTHYISLQNLLSLIFCLLIISGCDRTFQPLKKNTQYYFSIYGYLDASADTQWVRVAPPRKQLSTDTIPEMTVTLEEVETGNRSVMHDSLFQPANGFNYINVWSTMDIKPEHTYRLVAKRPDGAVSSVTVTTPPDFPTPILRFPFSYPYDECEGKLRIKEVEHLADIQSVWHFKLNSSGKIRNLLRRYPYRSKSNPSPPNGYRITIPSTEELILPAGEIEDYKRELFIASAGPEWREEISSIEDLEYALPEGISNVKNGLGYMIGIVSKTIPYNRYYIFNSQNQISECMAEKPQ